MSIIYMGYGWKLDLEPTELLVYLAISDHVDDDGEGCYASYKKLAAKTNLGRSTVIRVVDKLAKAGIIVHQGAHPQYGTNVWNIDKDKLPFKKPELKGKRATSASAPASAKRGKVAACGVTAVPGLRAAPGITETPGITATPGECHGETLPGLTATPGAYQGDTSPSLTATPPQCHSGTPPGVTAGPKPLVEPLEEPLEEPSVEPSGNHPGGRRPLPPALDARVNPAAKTKLARERAKGRAEAGEEDLQARDRPQTDLQRKVAQLCNAKYLTSAMKTGLRGTVSTAWRGNSTKRPVTHPSPEDEWASYPELFAEYVELCARRISEESGQSPSRDNLVQTIRNYARYNTGWLDFKKAAQEEARVAPPPKERPLYWDPNKPSWMQ